MTVHNSMGNAIHRGPRREGPMAPKGFEAVVSPLGQPLPLDDHATSVSMPLWSDVCGYEEGRREVSAAGCSRIFLSLRFGSFSCVSLPPATLSAAASWLLTGLLFDV